MRPVPVEAAKNTKSVAAGNSMTGIVFGEGAASPVAVQGFKGAAVEANIRYKGRADLGLIVSDVPAVVAGVFTRNRVKAAPVVHSIELFSSGTKHARAILVNSGNANACTGAEGLEDVKVICGMAAHELGLKQKEIHMCSTGVIGEPLPVEKFEKALPNLVSELRKEGLNDVARAIMTTDTVPKMAWACIENSGRKTTVLGIAKGAGMIAPDMGPPHATMLSFLLTDARVNGEWWQELISSVVEKSFNRITVDGDTSTNDTVLALANGMADASCSEEELFNAVNLVTASLATQIVADGEGATKCVKIEVTGACDSRDAELVARTIANSPLVKTAFYGQDPNWGRIIAAAGRSGVNIEPDKISIAIDEIKLVKNGKGLGKENEAKAQEIMKGDAYSVIVDLGLGNSRSSILTCDLTVEYININAEYRS